MNDANNIAPMAIPEETENLNFMDAFMPEVLTVINKAIISSTKSAHVIGQNRNEKYTEWTKVVASDESEEEKIAREIKNEKRDNQRHSEKAAKARARLIENELIRLREESKNQPLDNDFAPTGFTIGR